MLLMNTKCLSLNLHNWGLQASQTEVDPGPAGVSGVCKSSWCIWCMQIAPSNVSITRPTLLYTLAISTMQLKTIAAQNNRKYLFGKKLGLLPD